METRSRTRLLLRGAAVLAALGALTAPATAGAAVKAPVITKVTPKSVNVGEKLIIRGKYFRRGKGRNRVLFHRSGGKSLFVRADVSTKLRMTVVIPARLERLMPQPGGHPAPARFRLRVLTSKLSRRYSSAKNSPLVGPRLPKVVPPPVAPADGDCDGDGVINGVDGDDDNDLLSDSLEATLRTNPCNGDSDGDGVEDGYEYQSAIDLNNDDYQNPNTVIPYPGKRPYPNPLYKDANLDYDGDGLSLATEYDLWKYTYTVNHTAARTLSPLSYSDGAQYSLSHLQNGTGVRLPDMAVTAYAPPQTFASWASVNGYGAIYDFDGNGLVTDNMTDASAAGQLRTEKYYWNLDNDLYVSDDERDEDGDGLTNYDETTGRMTPGYWSGCYTTETAYPVPYAGSSPVDADSDGDGVLDGADDQDHDDIPNIAELSRQMAGDRAPQWGSMTCKVAQGQDADPSAPRGRVNPFNPCLPNAASRTCERHPDIGGTGFAPFDDNGAKYLVLN